MTEADRRERYRDSLVWLERRHCYLAAEVMELGRPMWVESTETAYVAFVDGELVFGFNPAWFDRLNRLERVAVLLHETMHVVHRHLHVGLAFTDAHQAHLYNLACDAVVNDKLTRCDPELLLPHGAVTGPALIGRDTRGMTAEQVFAVLRQASHPIELPCVPAANGVGAPSCLAEESGSDNGTPRSLTALTTLDDHAFWDHEEGADVWADPGRAELDRRLAELLGECTAADRWGNEAAAVLRRVPERDVRLDLERLLWRKIGRKRVMETRWVPPARRLACFYPGVLLPSYPARRLRRVLLALDASGSVSSEMLGVFVALSRRRWPDCQVRAVSFDTQVYPFSPGQPGAPPRGGGGTSFQAVEQFATSQARYPDLVVVFTDGQAPRPQLCHPGRWLWCLSCAAPPPALRGLGECIALPRLHARAATGGSAEPRANLSPVCSGSARVPDGTTE